MSDTLSAWTDADRQAGFNAGEQAAKTLIDALAGFFRSTAEQKLAAHPELVALISNFVMDTALASHNGQPLPSMPPLPDEVMQEAAKRLGAEL